MQLQSIARPLTVIALGLLAGWLILATTIDRVFAKGAPRVALFWNPHSADANVRLSDGLLQDGSLDVDSSRIARHAETSWRRQPINPGAARLLAVVAAQGGDATRGQALAMYAESMSRRDVPTQMWLIESNVEHGQVAAALLHYDRALKASNEVRGVLFPILTAAADAPDIWRPLAGILATRPQWWRPFVEQFIPRSGSPQALYAIARRTGIDRGPTADAALLQATEKRLVELGAYAAAFDLYDRAHGSPRGTRPRLRNGNFEQPGGWDPFEWNLLDDPDLSAIRQPSPQPKGGSALFLTATNGRGGDLATQLVMLRPGAYAIAATVGSVGGDPVAYPHIVVRCAAGARELLDARFPVSGEGGARWMGSFVVPEGCSPQRILIRATSALEPTSTTPWIDDLAIRPKGH